LAAATKIEAHQNVALLGEAIAQGYASSTVLAAPEAVEYQKCRASLTEPEIWRKV
jgi:hypothetical protein